MVCNRVLSAISITKAGGVKVGKLIVNFGVSKKGYITFAIPYTSASSYSIVACQGQSLNIDSQYQNTGWARRDTATQAYMNNYTSQNPNMSWIAVGY